MPRPKTNGKDSQMTTSRKSPAAQRVSERLQTSFDHAPALERAIDRLFPADVLANLKDPDRPAPERLDQMSEQELRSTFSC